MHIFRLKHYIALALVFFSWSFVCHAQIIINEVELLPTTERFIELYNDSSSSVDLTGWYIQRKTASGDTFGSLVSKTYFEGKKIASGGYFVISKTDLGVSDVIHPDLTLTDSNTIQIKDASKGVVDSLEWGAIPQGESYQRVNNIWQNGSPTPGDKNISDSSSESDSDVDNLENKIDDNVEKENKTEDPKILKISTKIITDKVARAGVALAIESLTSSNQGDTYAVGKYVWNFGDGSSYTDNFKNIINHIYIYPGDYVINLSYYRRKDGVTPDATSKVNIKVVEPDIVIVDVGDEKDSYIEVENKSSYDFSLDGWTINAVGSSFTFPDNTILLPKKKIKISSRISGFNFSNIQYLQLLNPSGEVYASYPSSKDNSTYIKSGNNISSSKNTSSREVVNGNIKGGVINLNELKASAKDSDYEFSYKTLYILGLIFVIFLGVFTFFHFNKKPKYKDYPNEVEGEIKASDIKIIE